MKKLIVCICLSFLILIGFQAVSAKDSGTCGNNVVYSITGNTISFSKEDSSTYATWGVNCGLIIPNDESVTIIKIVDEIKGQNSYGTYVDNYKEDGYIGMFSGFEYIQEMDLSNLDVSNMTNMINMFYGCESLTSLNVSGCTSMPTSVPVSSVYSKGRKAVSVAMA